MTFQFRPAVRKDTPLLIALAGASGSGKTWSGLALAQGLVNGGKGIAVIDSEAGRATHYSNEFRFDHLDLEPPFEPARYLAAVQAAEKAGYDVIIVDSATHVYSGPGGIIEMHDADLDRMAGDPGAPGYWQRREACNMRAWVRPKTEHKKMVAGFLQIRSHLVFCFRAEEKVKMVKVWKNNKEVTEIVDDGWKPICEKSTPYEMTLSVMLTPDAPGIPQPIKMPGQLAHAFPQGRHITADSGRALKEWAHGGAQPATEPQKSSKEYTAELKAAIDVATHERELSTIAELDNEINDAEANRQIGPKQAQALRTEIAAARQTIEDAVQAEDEPDEQGEAA